MLSGLWPRPYPGNVKEVAPKSALCRHPVNPFPQKDSTLSKFGNGVYVAHPGSLLRGDHVVVTFASRACGGRGSVGMRGAGRAGLPCELAAACGRTALKIRLAGISVATCTKPSNPAAVGECAYGKTVWSWPSLLRSSCRGGVCEPNRADSIVNSRSEGGQKELGSRESTA